MPPARRWLVAATVADGAASVVLLVALATLAAVVARVLDDGADLDGVVPLLAALAALAVARGLAVGSARAAAHRAGAELTASVRADLVDQLAVLGPAGTAPAPTGELVALAGDGVEELEPWASQYLPARRMAVLVPLVVAGAIALIDPWTVAVLAFAGPMLVLLLALIGSRTRTRSQRRLAELTWLRGLFLDVLQGLATLKAFGRSQEEAETIEEVSRRHGDTTMAVLATAFQTSLVMEWAAVAATALVAVEVAFRVVAGDLAFGPALTVLVLTPEFFWPLRRLAVEYHAGAAGAAAAERIVAVLDAPRPTGADDPGPRPARAAPAPGPASPATGLAVSGLWVRYPGAPDPALRDVSLTVAPGEIVAVAGPSGAGKTTLARAVLGFVGVEQGRIVAGGVDQADVGGDRWRTTVAWVPQRPHLFADSAAANIALGAPGADHAAVVAAAEAAGARELIEDLPDGWDTPLGERGARLSGGQRQRIAIARALLVDRPVVVLDEPTAHLDPEAEAVVLAAVRRLARGRATLVIAHRPRTLALADRVVHLERGAVAS